jgi:L-cysteine desulfidase
MEPLGTKKGCAMKVRIPVASASAMTIITTNSTTLRIKEGFFFVLTCD